MVKVQRTTKRSAAKTNSRRTYDILGLLLFFCGAASLLCLIWQQEAPIPAFVADVLRLIAGAGAYVLPLVLMFVGAMLLIGYERLSLSHSTLGSLLLFVVFVTGRHLYYVPRLTQDVREAGGWIGALFGIPFHALLGTPISYLTLVLLSLVAVVFLVDQPMGEMLRRLHQTGKTGAQAAQRSLQRARESEGFLVARSPDAKVLAPATPEEAVRAQRAAKVAERALTPAKTPPPQAALPLDDTAEVEDEPATNRLLRMFHLTRNWRDQEEEEEESATVATATPAPPTPAASEPTTPSAPAKRVKSKPTEEGATPAPVMLASTTTLSPLTPFALPPMTLLAEAPPAVSKRSQSELTDNIRTIEQTLEQFNIGASVSEVASGPSVTRYEIQLAPGIKVSKIVSLADNLAMSLAAIDVRVEAPIPGKSAIGVEVPNATPVTVSLRECLETEEFRNAPSKLTFALGKDVSGQYKYADLTKMPHLLIGGSTNSGKSVCLNVIIASLLYRATPRELKLLMIDPKRVELSLWDGIPHLMHPVVKDVKQAAGLFRAALREMDRRYDLFAALGTRNLDGYNQRVPESEKMPYIVLIVDELADLMIQQGPEVETSICRLAQLARATGIHLVIATQRPSVDIITGTIKANIASRIAFAVASQVDSRTILDMVGAERLIGRGDMLFMPIDAAKPLRLQGCYLSETETNTLVQYLKDQEQPNYTFTLSEGEEGQHDRGFAGSEDEVDDSLLEQAIRLVVNNGQASTSMLQRRFRIGYTRAARIVEMMEERGVVGPLNGAKPREILVSRDEVERMFNPGGPLPSVADYEDEE